MVKMWGGKTSSMGLAMFSCNGALKAIQNQWNGTSDYITQSLYALRPSYVTLVYVIWHYVVI